MPVITASSPVTILDDVYKTLSPEPLVDARELAAFYRGEDLNKVRGDKVAYIKLGLKRALGGAHYKCFLMGHSGVGKSTELSRLIGEIESQYKPIRFSALTDLNPGNFQPFDVLLIMMIMVAEQSAKPIEEGGAGFVPSKGLQQRIWDWFATETHKVTTDLTTSGSVEAGAGVKGDSVWGQLLGLFGNIRGEVKYASDRKTEFVQYRLQRLSTLIELLNQLFDECNEALREATGREWLLIGEDFDRAGIPTELTRSLFLNYANIFKDLHTHLIFNIPIALPYSEKAPQLPTLSGGTHCLPDTPVFHQDHTPHQEGREALKIILDARVDPSLFDDGQQMRLIVASGGNVRNLFTMTARAADNAILRPSSMGTISSIDTDAAINEMRTNYERSLGEGAFDEAKVTYEQKSQRLIRIYNGEESAKIPDPVLYSLLHARAVQEFNGTRWFGVHPLVVDILHAQGLIPRNAQGVLEGGTLA